MRKNQEGRQGLGLRLPRPCRLCAFAAFFGGRATDVEGLFTCHRATAVGSEEARLRTGLRPPLKLHVQVACMQLSRRLSDAGMTKKELSRALEQARTRRKAWAKAAASSQRCSNAYTDVTKSVAGSSRRADGRAYERGRVCNTRPSPAALGRYVVPFVEESVKRLKNKCLVLFLFSPAH